MPNITVTVSEQAYRAARIWAAQNDTSVSAVVQYCIERLPRLPIAQQAAAAAKTPNHGCVTVKEVSPNSSEA
jgi:hypothetical protein